MTSQQILVTKSGNATIQCPKCEKRKSIPAETFKMHKHKMMVACSCSHVFEINLNFRTHFRKQTSLAATYQKVGANYSKHPFKTPDATRTVNCTVTDLSLGGMSFEVMGRNTIEVGNKLLITFNLDNAKKTLIHTTIIVRIVRGTGIGAEFEVPDAFSPEFGFYLMP